MPTATAAHDVLEALNFLRRFSTFLSALEQSGIAQELHGAGPFTIFAPTDAAMDRLPHQTWRDLMQPGNGELLYDIASYHIVPGEVHAVDLKPGKQLLTLGGQHLTTCSDRHGVLCLDRSHILQADLVCANGLVHAIDKVLLPGNRD